MFACAIGVAGCAGSESADTKTPVVEEPAEAIAFSTDIDNSNTTESTRATTGPIDNTDALKALPEGFGVIAYLTDDKTWSAAKAAATPADDYTLATSSFPRPDFMYNQQVKWGGTLGRWTYSPTKYWPNSTGNTTNRYVSFFAYAPFVEGTFIGTTGVTGMTWESDLRPHVIYTVDETGNSTDLLWAKATDQTRNGQGLIYYESGTEKWQAVPLQFHHALACVDVYVQRVYDEPTYSGKKPADDNNVTKLFMQELTFFATNTTSNGLFKSGRLNLEDGTWSDYTDSSDPENPKQAWQAGTVTLHYPATAFVDNLAGTQSGEPEEIRNAELEKWGVSGSGVDEVEELLFKAGSIMLIPQSSEITITPGISYSMVTRGDPGDLVYSPLTDAAGNHYNRIVNTVQGNDIQLKLEAAKRYKLVIRIGVEHVAFIVAGIEDWDFPVRLRPDATSSPDENIYHTVNEE